MGDRNFHEIENSLVSRGIIAEPQAENAPEKPLAQLPEIKSEPQVIEAAGFEDMDDKVVRAMLKHLKGDGHFILEKGESGFFSASEWARRFSMRESSAFEKLAAKFPEFFIKTTADRIAFGSQIKQKQFKLVNAKRLVEILESVAVPKKAKKELLVKPGGVEEKAKADFKVQKLRVGSSYYPQQLLNFFGVIDLNTALKELEKMDYHYKIIDDKIHLTGHIPPQKKRLKK